MEIIIFILIVVIIVLLTKNSNRATALSKTQNRFNQFKKDAKREIEKAKTEVEKINMAFNSYQLAMEPLRKYEGIKNIEEEAQKIKYLAQIQLNSADEEAKDIMRNARAEAKELKSKAQQKLDDAHSIATKIEVDAQRKAMEVAGEAWKAKENAEQYQQTVQAMKNIISGYGDEYLIPAETLLDELAEEYDHTEAGRDLANTRTLIKSMIKNKEVADCDYVEQYRRETAIEFIIDAFNGKVDSIMSKVKHDNYGILLQKLNDAYRIVNHNGQPFKNTRIRPRYFEVVVEQLRLSVIVQELKKKDREEQRRIREEIREEERARKEYEKAIKQAEKEEKMLAKALKQAEEKLKQAAADEKAKYEQQLNELLEELQIAKEKGQRAISMAQQTKQGHVYIISNIGSFGENIFKIGLTRRLNPLDRVKELGDASVPFSFDVHAIIHSEDAPNLERELHKAFKGNQVNKVNPRKEFFNIPLTDIKNKVLSMNLENDTHWTMKAEAMEYRESLQLSKKQRVAS